MFAQQALIIPFAYIQRQLGLLFYKNTLYNFFLLYSERFSKSIKILPYSECLSLKCRTFFLPSQKFLEILMKQVQNIGGNVSKLTYALLLATLGGDYSYLERVINFYSQKYVDLTKVRLGFLQNSFFFSNTSSVLILYPQGPLFQ